MFIFSVGISSMILYPTLRSPSTHNMSPWVRTVFITFMPKIMFMQRSPIDMPDFNPEYNGYTNEIDVR